MNLSKATSRIGTAEELSVLSAMLELDREPGRFGAGGGGEGETVHEEAGLEIEVEVEVGALYVRFKAAQQPAARRLAFGCFCD